MFIYERILVTLLFISLNVISSYEEKLKHLNIGAVFPMSGDWAGGIGCRPAALMALNDVNNQSEILRDYNLTITMEDSKCIPGLGAKMMYELLYKPPTKIIFLTGCSTVTTFVAQAAPRWNLIVMAYGASSPALSNRKRFPSFFRTHPSASLQNPTRMKLIKRLGWKKISIIWEMEEVFTSTVQDLEKMAKELNITIVKRQSFQKHSQSLFLAVKFLVNENARIIVGLFYENYARKVFCEAYHQGLYGKKVVWIIIGWYADDWWKSNLEQENINCTIEEMKTAVEGHLTTESLMWNNDDKETIGGLTSAQFRRRLVQMLQKEPSMGQFNEDNISSLTKIPGYPEAPLAYDAVWAVALALDKAEKRLKKMGLSLSDFRYHDSPNIVYEQLHKAMNETNFMGVSTLVYFDSSGSRISWTKIEQMIGGCYNLIGYYHFETDNLTLVAEPVWQIRHKNAPRDSIEIVHKRQVLSLPVYISICCLVIICGSCSSVCVLMIQKNSQHRTIYDGLKMVCCTGCIISLCGVVLLGLDRTTITEVTSNVIFSGYCQVKVATISMGFNLGYGSLFLSIWLVYRTATKGKKLTTMQTLRNSRDAIKEESRQRMDKFSKSFISKTMKNTTWEIRGALSAFCILDLAVLVIWQYFDPLSRTRFDFPKETNKLDEDIHYYPYIEMCECKNLSLWLGIIFGWKGLLLILGILLAYETKNTKMSKSEDIRTTCMAVYNVVILSLITGPVSIMIRNQQTAHFAFVSVSILACCSLSIGLIFVPKIIRHRKGIMDQDSIIISDVDTFAVSQDEDTNRNRLKIENEDLKLKISKIEKEIEKLQVQLTIKNRKYYDSKNNSQLSESDPFCELNGIEYYKKRNKKKVMITEEPSLQMDQEIKEEMSTCVENTSGVYSDLLGTASANCVTKY